MNATHRVQAILIVAISITCTVYALLPWSHLTTWYLRKAGGSDEGETHEGATGHTAATCPSHLHFYKAQGML